MPELEGRIVRMQIPQETGPVSHLQAAQLRANALRGKSEVYKFPLPGTLYTIAGEEPSLYIVDENDSPVSGTSPSFTIFARMQKDGTKETVLIAAAFGAVNHILRFPTRDSPEFQIDESLPGFHTILYDSEQKKLIGVRGASQSIIEISL